MEGKTLWEPRYKEIFEFYCPVCSTPKRLPFKPRPQPRHYLQIALTSLMVTLATWPIFGAKGFVCFIPLWATFETVYRLRVRKRMQCGSCAFDPYLYLVDVQKARAQVDAHWRKVFADKGIPFPEKSGKTIPKEKSEVDSPLPSR